VIPGAVRIAGPEHDAGGSVGDAAWVQVVKIGVVAQVVVSQGTGWEPVANSFIQLNKKMGHVNLLWPA
jgi:hypothetical protein